MILVETIEIEKFRGIRALSLNLKKENFGICGPNGTGKSGVVDAIEFALTGNISRLSGRGTGSLSVKSHAPHVKECNEPKLAKVALTAFIPSLAKSATITRTVATPSNYTLEPDSQDIKAVFEEAEQHPEFVLSRREVIRYILSEPNTRAKDVQELLRLDEVEQTRKHFRKVVTKMRNDKDTKQQMCARQSSDLLHTLKIDQWDSAAILGAINKSREVFSLSLLEKLERDTSFKVGVSAAQKSVEAPIKKAKAISDIEQINQIAISGENESTAAKRKAVLEDIEALIADAASIRHLKHQSLIKAGIELVENNSWPLCDTEWQRDELLRHLETKLQSAIQAKELFSRLTGNLNHIIGELEAYVDLLLRILSWSAKLEPIPDMEALSAHKDKIEASAQTLRDFVSTTENIDAIKDAVIVELVGPP